MFLGYNKTSKNDQIESSEFIIKNIEKNVYNSGSFAYSINKNGAKMLIDYIEKNGIKYSIEQIIMMCEGLKVTELEPQIVFSNETVNNNDDIKTLDFSNIDTEYFTFMKGVDHIGDDLFFNTVSIEEAKKIAFTNPECVGFNTLGFSRKRSIYQL